MELPKIIQGGMGPGVSSWRLARAVSSLGQLGVVSGTALDVILARRLQQGDPDGSIRHALGEFPVPEIAQRILTRYYVRGGKEPGRPYRRVPMHTLDDRRTAVELCIAAGFVEVFLAREGHGNPVGINFLEKAQLPILPSLYGAMLGGVSVVLIRTSRAPTKIPASLRALSNHESACLDLQLSENHGTGDADLCFDPMEYVRGNQPPLLRPLCFPIVTSDRLAKVLLQSGDGMIDGFVVEGHTGGGLGSPPRGLTTFDSTGALVYGRYDVPILERFRELGVPFWVAGGQATAERLRAAEAAGAAGVQIGTAFAFCEESGINPELRRTALEETLSGMGWVYTDPIISPTGDPFKVVSLKGTVSESAEYRSRQRICDLGFMRQVVRSEDGEAIYRCPSEPIEDWVGKGGDVEEVDGRRCLCNGMMASIGLGQVRPDGTAEKPLLTAGDDLLYLDRFLHDGATSYTARDVVESVLSPEGDADAEPSWLRAKTRVRFLNDLIEDY